MFKSFLTIFWYLFDPWIRDPEYVFSGSRTDPPQVRIFFRTRKRVREGGGGGVESGYRCTECRYQCTTAVLNYFSSEVIKKKLANFQRILEIFVKKLFKIFQHLPCPARESGKIIDSKGQRIRPATGAIFFRTRKRVREGGGGEWNQGTSVLIVGTSVPQLCLV